VATLAPIMAVVAGDRCERDATAVPAALPSPSY
jgi:hypothetical protein